MRIARIFASVSGALALTSTGVAASTHTAMSNGMAVRALVPERVGPDIWGLGVAAPQVPGARAKMAVALWWVPPSRTVAGARLVAVERAAVLPGTATVISAKWACRPTRRAYRWVTTVAVNTLLAGHRERVAAQSRVALVNCLPARAR